MTLPVSRLGRLSLNKSSCLNAESQCLCGFPAFVLSNGSSLALFVGRVIDANVIIEMNEKEKMI